MGECDCNGKKMTCREACPGPVCEPLCWVLVGSEQEADPRFVGVFRGTSPSGDKHVFSCNKAGIISYSVSSPPSTAGIVTTSSSYSYASIAMHGWKPVPPGGDPSGPPPKPTDQTIAEAQTDTPLLPQKAHAPAPAHPHQHTGPFKVHGRLLCINLELELEYITLVGIKVNGQLLRPSY